MPLRPEIRPLYGPAWRAFRERFALTHPPICSKCKATGAYMNLAHRTHEAGRREERLVVWFCPHCHGVHDTPHRIAITRRTRAKKVGQLWLLPEIEFAPYDWIEIPPEVNAQAFAAALQEGLPL